MAVLEMIFITLISFIFFIIFFYKHLSSTLFSAQKNVPPSPRKLPIIGNLHQLGTSPHRSLQAISNIYGHLLLVHLGRVPVLVVSSAHAAREIMKNQDTIFSNRPISSITDRLFYGTKDLVFSPYGEHWRQVRSISVVHLLSNKNVQSCRHVRKEETSAMVEKIKQLGSSASVVNLSDVLVSLTNNIISRVALGRKYGEDKNFGKLLKEIMEVLGTTMSYRDHIPFLGWIIDRINGLDAKVERVAKEFNEFLENVIQEHRDGKRDDGDGGELDFVDLMFEFQKENHSVSPVDDDTIKAIILDMFAAGTDTVSSPLEWAVSQLIKNPRSMKILRNQVRQVAGAKKEIDEDDIKKMPYLKAVIKESLRLHAPVPLIPHESTQDTKVMGYDIPAGTRVFINVWAIGRDPSLWENPEEFRPERFLDSSVDYKGLHFELIPFGAGRRGCPGIAFAEAIYELALAKLVHCFNFALPFGEREEDLDMSETSGINVRKNHPLLLVVTTS